MEKQLPKNWVETNLEHLFNLVYGKGLSVSELLDEGFDVYGANGIIGKYDKFTYEKSKVIISCRGAASGAIHKTKPKSFITSNSIVLDEVSDKLLNLDFVKYAMTIADKSDVITGTAQPQITIQLLKYLQFPLPPLAEQNRIVAKLDTLFVQLETIKTSMAKVPLLLEDFRQQVLTQAVTGKLTEEWRKGKELEEWKVIKVGKFMIEVKDKIDPTKIDEVPYIGLEHIQKDGGVIEIGISSDLKSNKTVFKKGDVIYGKLRPYLNKHDVVNFDGICSTDILVYRNENLNSSKFFNFFLGNSSTIEMLNGEAKGINLPRVSASIVNNLDIKIPSAQELQEIVSRVESLFAKADAIEKQYETLKAKIDSLPQAILHKAFKGELTEQLDTDGDARELLKEIEGLKAAMGKKGKSNTTKSVAKTVNQ